MAHEFDGQKYQEAATHQHEWGKRLVHELQLDGTESVLDLGCGDGSVTELIADIVPSGEVLGIDASQGMLDAARLKERRNLRFARMDIDGMCLDHRFDVIFSNATLHWLKNHRKLMPSIMAALKPGGMIRLNFAGAGNCTNFFRAVRQVMKAPAFARHFEKFEWPWYMPTLDEYRPIVIEAGFLDVEVWTENADRVFPTQEAIAGWIDQPCIVPFLSPLPNEAKKPFRDATVYKTLELARHSSGGYSETFRRINVLARR